MGERLTYANVVATVALFLALGGGAYAAIDLVGRNDIKSKHIAKDAAKGKDIAEATLGQVPAAASAATAATAATADEAARVNGLRVAKIDYRRDVEATPVTILDLAGLTLEGSCAPPLGDFKVFARTTKQNSSLYGFAQYPPFDGSQLDSFDYEDGAFDPGMTVDLAVELDSLGTPRIGSLAYHAPDGSVVSVDFASNINGVNECEFTGIATGG